MRKDTFDKFVFKSTPRLFKLFDLGDMEIKIISTHNKSKIRKKFYNGIICGGADLTKNSNKCNLILCRDQHLNKRQVLSTLIHECLHIKLWKLVSKFKRYSKKREDIEEEIVRSLEYLINELFWSK